MSKSKVTEQHYVECATCKNYSKFYCNTCHQRICEQCRHVHLSGKENRKHQVVLYQERLKELPTEKCPIHPTKILEIFCADCPTPVCSKCFTTDHNGHQVLDLEVVYNECLQQCQEELINIRDNILPQCVEEVKSQKERVEETKKKIWKLRSSMKQSADEIKEAIDNILAVNNSKLDIIEASILDEIVKQQKKLENYISYLNKLVENYSSDLSSCKLTEVIRYNKKSKNILLMKFPEIIEHEVPTFAKGRIIKKEIEAMFGHINPCAEEKILKEVKKIQESIHQFNSKPTQKLSMELLSSIPKGRVVNLSGLNAVFHLSPAVPSSLFWASDGDGNLILFDMQGNTLKKISTRKQKKGYHAVTKENNLLYTDYMTKTVYRVNDDMTTTALVSTKDWEPWSICSSYMKGDILVGMKKHEKWKITRYNKDGMKLQDIQKNDNGRDLYSDVSFLTENINGDICTSDCNASKVQVVTGSGEYRFSYSGYHSLYGFVPQGICTDVNGNILVVGFFRTLSPYYKLGQFFFEGLEREFDIHLLDQDGQFLSFLLKQNLLTPTLRALCLDDQNNLIAGSAQIPTVRVFNYLKSKHIL